MLNIRKEAFYKHGERIDYHDTSFLLTEMKRKNEYVWLSKVSSVVLQQSLRHLNLSFLNFWEGRAKYPRFKKKSAIQHATYAGASFTWDGKNFKLAKQKEILDIRWSRFFTGEPSTITISTDAAGRYFISVLVEEEIKPKNVITKRIGIDLGIKDVVVGSDCFKSGSPAYTKKYKDKLAKAQRNLDKKKFGSKNYTKAKLKVGRIHAKIADCRRDFTHKLSTKLINENQVIAAETLIVKDMMKDRFLSQGIADSNWGELLRQLNYKAQWYSRQLIRIDKWFPSSKRCSVCGWIKNDIKLSDRTWSCKNCGVMHDRDINAALNILAVGQAVSAFGENVSGISKKEKSCFQ